MWAITCMQVLPYFLDGVLFRTVADRCLCVRALDCVVRVWGQPTYLSIS